MEKNSKNQVLIMAACAVIGGVIGWLVGLYWMSPAVLIPIGTVIGVAVGLAISKAS